MKQEKISGKQTACITVMFMLGSSLVFGISSKSNQDAWIAILIALAAAVPLLYYYARLLCLYPGQSLFDICISVFGRFFGKAVIALYAWYAFHLGALVIRNYSEFLQVRVFIQMPQIVSMLIMVFLVIWVVRRGVEVLGRYTVVTLPVIVIIIIAVLLLLVKDMRLEYMLPVGEYLSDVPSDVFNDFSFPFMETVLLLCVLSATGANAKPGKPLVAGLLIGGLLLTVSLVRNCMTLGFPMHGDKWFPSYDAGSLIIVGSVVSRIENFVGANLLLAGFVKISVCLFAASKGCARLVDADDYRPFAAPVGLLMVGLASIVYKNTMEMYDFLLVYRYYAFPFQIILPLLLCLVAEIRHAVKTRKEKGGVEPDPSRA